MTRGSSQARICTPSKQQSSLNQRSNWASSTMRLCPAQPRRHPPPPTAAPAGEVALPAQGVVHAVQVDEPQVGVGVELESARPCKPGLPGDRRAGERGLVVAVVDEPPAALVEDGPAEVERSLAVGTVQQLVAEAVDELLVESVDIGGERPPLRDRGHDLVDVGDEDHLVAVEQVALERTRSSGPSRCGQPCRSHRDAHEVVAVGRAVGRLVVEDVDVLAAKKRE